ncbi:hypothetical protein [Streptomyces sp. NPDC001680]
MNRHATRDDGEMSMRGPLDDDSVEPEGGEPYDEVADPLTGTVRVCARRCDTCIFHPGNLMDLKPGRVANMVAGRGKSRGTWSATRPWARRRRRSAEASPMAPTRIAASPSVSPARWARCGRSPRHDRHTKPAGTGHSPAGRTARSLRSPECLAERHPPGDRLHRVTHALRQTATELDAAYALAREAGRELRTLLVVGHEVAVALKRQINYEAAELALALVLCEVVDTALIRVLGNYQDIVQAARHPA